MNIFNPKIIESLKGYNRKTFIKDLTAGAVVGIVALPMAIAFGIASGVTPQQGIITAIIAGFIISFFGGSKVQIGGPTGAFIVIVAGVVSTYGMLGLLVATMMAGIMLLLMGIFKFGDIIKFIPYPVIVGFTSGIALVIFSTQMNDFFGLGLLRVPAAFHEKWIIYFQNINNINLWAVGIAVFTVFTGFFWVRINKSVPGSLVAIILTTLAVWLFDLPVETIGSRFGEIVAEVPAPALPVFTFESLQTLLPVAFTIAMLGAIESLLSAMVADGAIGDRHNSNTELIAQGVANIVTPLFGGIPATGAIARTMTNIKNGGRTPVAGIVHAVVLLLLLLIFGKMAKMIPMPCLAGILVIIAYNMSEWRSFRGLLKNSRADVAVLLITFFLTVVFDLTIAIGIGLLLAVLLFVRRISQSATIQIDEQPATIDETPVSLPKGVDVFHINGPFFFGVANKFEEAFLRVSKPPKVRIIDMGNVPFIDSTGIQNLTNFWKKCRQANIKILLARVNPAVLETLKKNELYNNIGVNQIFFDFDGAVEEAREMLK
ncbi:MAG: sulfate permease [Bacteroidales bacterium]|jgi:SulP family sulfate permease|nr:sulfate permease [Bacteroidales bacterium]